LVLIFLVTNFTITCANASYRFQHDIFPNILKYEGAAYTDHSWDPGGPTKYGITLRTYNAVTKKNITKEQLKLLTEKEAMQFYEDNFWYKYNADNIANDELATAVVLAQINLGPSRPNMLLEKMLNDFCKTNLVPNGHLSDQEVEKINNCKYLWPGYGYMLFYLYKEKVVKSTLWVKIENGIRNRVMEGVV